MKPLLPLIFAAILCSPVVAQEEAEKKHPVDVKVKKLEAKAESTADSMQVYAEGLELWDKEMNRVYAELRKLLTGKVAEALKESQRKWIVARDAEIAFINECYDQYEGTMYRPMRAAAIMNLTRSRALELLHRLEVHQDAAP